MEAEPSTIDACAARGKQLLQEGSTEPAIACLCKALELTVAEHGPMSPSCAYAYYAYADALLQKAQAESNPFGDAVQKLEEEGEGEEDDDEEDVDATDEVLVGGKAHKLAAVAAAMCGSAPPCAGSDAPCVGRGVGPSAGGGPSDLNAPAVAEGADGEEADGMERDDLQAAWECFEIARLLFEKRGDDPKARRRVADCLLGLADIRMENEDFVGAVTEYAAALAIFEQVLEAHDRTLSHTHYQLGIAHQLNGRAPDAAAEFEKAAAVLRLRVAALGADEERAAEVRELRELVHEIEEKIAAEAEPSGIVPVQAGPAGPIDGVAAADAAAGAAAAVTAVVSGAVAAPVDSGGFGKPQLAAAAVDGASAPPVSVLTVRRKAPQAGGSATATAPGAPGAAGAHHDIGAAVKKQRASLA
ncbi:hypothetical protein KFE25_008209 [Diacronema lutheri]|uniref:Tetratricopeptide SHNi-TPR domain-containing protein n=1 Tax=Diacronema lutheri TaxID=2081491 RepID=A0A8J5XRZ1_DIALT|nr:hypothetical protein KFE25_008209 [Diacronema lutheri]